jgi:hypothetical protein
MRVTPAEPGVYLGLINGPQMTTYDQVCAIILAGKHNATTLQKMRTGIPVIRSLYLPLFTLGFHFGKYRILVHRLLIPYC